MWQACVKALPKTNGHLLLTFSSQEEREEFVKGPQVFWYVFAEDDALFADGWRKGGAWTHVEPTPEPDEPGFVPEVDYGERW